jgi:hypothetical protein
MMWHCAAYWAVANVSEEPAASILRVKVYFFFSLME